MSASIKVVLFTHKVLKNGYHPIYLRVIKDRKTKYITLGSCSLKMWDEKENMPKKKHPLYKELSILVEKKRLEAKKLLYDLDTHENAGGINFDKFLDSITDKLGNKESREGIHRIF